MIDRFRKWRFDRVARPTYGQLAADADAVVIQREDLCERLGRIRAAAESDPDLPGPLRDFLLHEAQPGCLHVTSAMVESLRATGDWRPVERRDA